MCKICTKKVGIFYVCTNVPKIWYIVGTSKRAHKLFGYFGYYSADVCIYLLSFNKCIDNKHCTRFIFQ